MKAEPWTEERDAQLTKLRNHGFSSTQIAVELGGVTRNAVIGRAMRLGLDKRRPGTRGPLKKKQFRMPSVPKTASPYAAITIHDQSDNPVALLDLEPHHCRWPMQDVPYLFCADAKQDGSSYCSRHFSVSRRGVATGP